MRPCQDAQQAAHRTPGISGKSAAHFRLIITSDFFVHFFNPVLISLSIIRKQ
jgi:hypothetical protein